MGIFYLIEDVLEVIIPYRFNHGQDDYTYQNLIHWREARYLPCGDVVHESQYDETIKKLNSFTLNESEAIHG